MPTLLEKAMKETTNGKITAAPFDQELFDLAIAYVDHKITYTQAKKTLGVKDGTLTYKLFAQIIQGYRKGLLILKK